MRFNREYIPAIGLGITTTIAYGTLYYSYGILLPYMSEDIGLTLSNGYLVLSLAMFCGVFLAPWAGKLTDRHGGRYVMAFGSFLAGLSLLSMSLITGMVSLFFAIVFAQAAAMFVFYPVAFASLVKIKSSIPTQRSITIVTLFAGVASSIFWPSVTKLFENYGWQQTWVFLGIFMLAVCVPIHYFALNRPLRDVSEDTKKVNPEWPELEGKARKQGMFWMTVSFVFTGYFMGAVMALWVPNAKDMGHAAIMAAYAGSVIGVFKTLGRFVQMLISQNMYPSATYVMSLALMIASFSVLLTFGFTLPGIMIAAALYGMGDGIKTIASGTLPLALFGPKGYGERLGWLNWIMSGMNASAPFVFAFITQAYGGWISFAVMSVVLAFAFATFFLIPDPRKLNKELSHETA